MSGGGTEAAQERAVVYCVVPRELAGELHDPLRRHFRNEPSVEVVVERREEDRRIAAQRRVTEDAAAPDRRQIRNRAGRRIHDRRAAVVGVSAPPLPRRLRRHAEQLTFIERLEPSSQHLEDVDTARLVLRIQAGDDDAFGLLYARYFDRVYNYLRLALRDRHEAEDATQQVFTKVLEALPRYEQRDQPFRVWLFVVVRHLAVDTVRGQARLKVLEPQELARRHESAGGGIAEDEPDVLSWITDRELLLFVERLPIAQRQVLVLRYMLDLSHSEVAAILGRSSEDVRTLQHRALTFLRARLVAVGRGPAPGKSVRMRRGVRKAPVLRARRFALHV